MMTWTSDIYIDSSSGPGAAFPSDLKSRVNQPQEDYLETGTETAFSEPIDNYANEISPMPCRWRICHSCLWLMAASRARGWTRLSECRSPR